MNFTTCRVVTAIALSLSLASVSSAQTKVSATLCGNLDARALNVARATALVSSTPGVQEELSSQGDFLGFSGHYYTVLAESYGSPKGRLGFGKWELRVGSNTVRSSFATTLNASHKVSTSGDALSADATRQYTVGGVPILVRGNVRVDLAVNLRYAWPVSSVRIDGSLSGRATGRASAVVGLAPWIFGVTESHVLDFGRQKFDGKAEVLKTGDNSTLSYDMTPMQTILRLSVTWFGSRWSSRNLVVAGRGPIHVASFL